MSSVQLLDKTRKIGKLLHNNNSSKVVFNDICNVLKEILQSNVLVISKKGKILGVGRTDGIETLDELFESKVGVFVDSLLNERSIWKRSVMREKRRTSIKHFCPRSTLRENVSVRSLFIRSNRNMKSMILSSVSMERR